MPRGFPTAFKRLADNVAANSGQISWVTRNPTNPYVDYYKLGDKPERNELGDFSLMVLPSQNYDIIWANQSTASKVTIYPTVGSALVEHHWSRSVDNVTNVVLTLNGNNLSTSWVKLSDDKIAPRRQS